MHGNISCVLVVGQTNGRINWTSKIKFWLTCLFSFHDLSICYLKSKFWKNTTTWAIWTGLGGWVNFIFHITWSSLIWVCYLASIRLKVLLSCPPSDYGQNGTWDLFLFSKAGTLPHDRPSADVTVIYNLTKKIGGKN
jgi:hypothetical protein